MKSPDESTLQLNFFTDSWKRKGGSLDPCRTSLTPARTCSTLRFAPGNFVPATQPAFEPKSLPADSASTEEHAESSDRTPAITAEEQTWLR